VKKGNLSRFLVAVGKGCKVEPGGEREGGEGGGCVKDASSKTTKRQEGALMLENEGRGQYGWKGMKWVAVRRTLRGIELGREFGCAGAGQ
jgi:hypothetical protein